MTRVSAASGDRPLRSLLTAAGLALALTVPAPATAASITIADPGTAFRLVFGPPVISVISQAQLITLVQAAATYWEGFLLDTRSFTIEVGFANLGSPNIFAAAADAGSRAVIAFNPPALWFVDPTPFDHSEYTTLTHFAQDFGAGPVNTGIVYGGATGAAAGRRDMLTVALQEIGHALGFREHLDLIPTAVMHSNVNLDERKLISDIDILTVADAGGFNSFVLNELATPVPEPATITLFATGVAAIWRRRASSRRTRARPGNV